MNLPTLVTVQQRQTRQEFCALVAFDFDDLQF